MLPSELIKALQCLPSYSDIVIAVDGEPLALTGWQFISMPADSCGSLVDVPVGINLLTEKE